MSTTAWNEMSPDDQKIFQECATEACAEGKTYARKVDQEFKQKCLDEGMELTTPDLAPFREKAKQLYTEYDAKYGDMIRKIQALAK